MCLNPGHAAAAATAVVTAAAAAVTAARAFLEMISYRTFPGSSLTGFEANSSAATF